MTDHLGNSWREVYAALDCSTTAHDQEQPAREADDDVTGVTATGSASEPTAFQLKAIK